MLLNHVEDVVLVNEFVLLRNLPHNREHHLLVITRHGPTDTTSTKVTLSRCPNTLTWLASNLFFSKDTLLANVMSDEHFKQMASHIVELVKLLDVAADNCFRVVEHTNVTIHFDVDVFPEDQF